MYIAALPLFLALWFPLSHSLDNGLARTPPMGWMSWAQFYCEIDCARKPYSCISERLYMDMADRIVEDGYRAVGYQSIHIDDCWMAMQRDETGTLKVNQTRFPSGMRALADYMHNKGLKLGIYEDYGTETCGGYPGSFGHLERDAQTFAEWKCDYLKLDGCYVNISQMSTGYPAMSRYLNATGREIVYSCSWPAYVVGEHHKPNYTAIAEWCNLWRNFDDISAKWSSILSIIDYYTKHQDVLIAVNGPGQWNDPDMLVIGQPTVTVDQAKAQMSIWCIWSAPLIMSNDLRLIAPVYRDILQNKRAIQINQDPLGKMGRMILNATNLSVFVKPITPVDSVTQQHSYAVVFFNRHHGFAVDFSLALKNLGLTNPTGYFVREIWTDTHFGLMKPDDIFSGTVNATGVLLVRADIAQSLDKFVADDAFLKI